MIGAALDFPSSRKPHILCIGAHCDDIEIGCGGTLLHLLDRYPGATVTWFVLTGDGKRHAETTQAAQAIVAGPSQLELALNSFRDGYLPYLGEQVKEVFGDLATRIAPDLVFSHWENDRHQDHRFIAELTWSTFRNQLILEYEIPKYDGDLGAPNFFVPLSEETVQRKIAIVTGSFASQQTKGWFDARTFMAVHRLRGIESGADADYAEGFYCRKLRLAD